MNAILTVLKGTIFTISIITILGCSNINNAEVENTSKSELESSVLEESDEETNNKNEWFKINVMTISENVEELKALFSSGTVEELRDAVDSFNYSVSDLKKIVPEGNEEYVSMLDDLQLLFDESIFDREGEVTNEEIEEWFNEYNDLLINISNFLSEKAERDLEELKINKNIIEVYEEK